MTKKFQIKSFRVPVIRGEDGTTEFDELCKLDENNLLNVEDVELEIEHIPNKAKELDQKNKGNLKLAELDNEIKTVTKLVLV